MRQHFEVTILCTTLLFFSAIGTSRADGPEGESPIANAAEPIELFKPGPEHEVLKSYSGNWRAKLTRDGYDPPASVGKMNCYMLMKGRYLWVGYDVRGVPGFLNGAFLIGFDRRNKQYSLVALDTLGTHLMTSRGEKGESGRLIRMRGTDDEPKMKREGANSQGSVKEYVYVLDIQNPDAFSVEVFRVDTSTPERTEKPAVKLEFTR